MKASVRGVVKASVRGVVQASVRDVREITNVAFKIVRRTI